MSALRHHFQSFLAGGASALGLGYYFLHQDVWRSAAAVEKRVDAMGADALGATAALNERVKSLEAEVAKLKALKQ